MKWTSKRGTVINIPDNATEKQIKEWKARANEGYGTEVTNAIKKFVKNNPPKAATPPPAPAPIATTPPPNASPSNIPAGPLPPNVVATPPEAQPGISPGAIDKKTGVPDPVKLGDDLVGAERSDIVSNITLQNPDQTDAAGNTRVTKINPDGTVSVTDTAGQLLQTFQDAAQAAAAGYQNLDLSGAPTVSGGTPEDRKRAEDAIYGTLTRFYDRDQAREMEAAQQELANRGIPYNPAEAYNDNTKNLYGKTIGAIRQNYEAKKQDAAQRAVALGNETMLANTSASNAANRAFVDAATAQHTGNLQGINSLVAGTNALAPSFSAFQGTTTDTSGILGDVAGMTVEAIMAKYGIDQDTAIKKKALAQQNRGSGGGGGSSGGGGGSAGFEIIS